MSTKYDPQTILNLINEGKIIGVTKLGEKMFLIIKVLLEDQADFKDIIEALEATGYVVTADDGNEGTALMQPERRHQTGVNMHRRTDD